MAQLTKKYMQIIKQSDHKRIHKKQRSMKGATQ